MPEENKSRRIVKNTVMLYARMLIVMIITLFSVRFVLHALGESDYGIYNVVAGVVLSLSFLNGAITSATQRYYSFAIGSKNEDIKNIFSASINIYIIISLIVLILAETIGLWFVNTYLNVPPERMNAVNWIYQFSVISFIVSIMTTPYNSAVIAYEDMNIYAIISIADCLLKFIFVILLYLCVFADKLITYGVMLMVAQILTSITYVVVCKKKYKKLRYVKINDIKLHKSMLSFSWWSMYGSLAGALNNQGNTILLNIFFGPITSAARAISLQVNSAVGTLSHSFLMAVKPPMIKSYAENNYDYLLKVFNFSNKFIFYSVFVVCLPLFMEMNMVLEIWLKREISSETVIFTRLILIYTIVATLNTPITTIMQASGHVKKYHLYVESFTLLSMPLTYLFFKLGFASYSTYIVMIAVFIAAHFIRLIMMKKEIQFFSIRSYCFKFVLPAVVIAFLSYIVLQLFCSFVAPSFIRLLLTVIISCIIVLTLAYTCALNKEEKEFLLRFLKIKK